MHSHFKTINQWKGGERTTKKTYLIPEESVEKKATSSIIKSGDKSCVYFLEQKKALTQRDKGQKCFIELGCGNGNGECALVA